MQIVVYVSSIRGTAILSDSDKQRIREEEFFRRAIEKELAPKPSFAEWVWKTLNSSFILWLLGSVVLAAFTTIYTRSRDAKIAEQQHQEYLRKLDFEAERSRQELVRKLDFEIEGRLSQYLALLKDARRAEVATQRAKRESDVFNAIAESQDPDWQRQARIFFALRDPPSSQQEKYFQSLHPEFDGMGLVALLADLIEQVPLSERKELIKVLGRLNASLDLKPSDFLRPTTIAARLHQTVLMPRWRSTFPLLRCSEREPFCE